ncbi:hypothetical protein PBI_TWEETY_102 [Mycobacterium phage Tweety]|uniref:Uncharacterized protein n=3 Tax=Cheoctovirus TaxID=1623281 RepID=A0A0K1Y7C4_9CAUD|nr:kinase [Mycobacterium phage Tweety]YP_009016991.1 kinase [Mycobacterium phage DeadP]YP_009212741.1 kinase [Mycobacterium phage Dante]ABQ86171.1 hypothetical protein PBI_TWEETY_102 [Mycobacterium phage Tweety]AER47843.1 Ser/Thr kinase [Mycobacterium phage DeadP]AKY03010.1 hypothetical protein SEA_DANTE_99 [Mycobacterium phage Dante]
MTTSNCELSKSRAILTIEPEKGIVTKRYRHPAAAAREIYWYRRLDYGHPELIDFDVDAGILVTSFHAPCEQLPDYRPVAGLIELLERLQADHIHHRDIHPGNVVRGPDGPLLIDWETAIEMDAPSYDLHGPASGVPVPDIHTALPRRYEMWLGSDHRSSIKTLWGLD